VVPEGDSSYTWGSTEQAERRLDLKDPTDLDGRQGSRPAGRRRDRELPTRRDAPLGLDEPAVRLRTRAVVYCRILGIGRGDVAGYDFLAQAVGGLMSVTGDPEGEPRKVGVALVDVMAGLHAAIGIVAAAPAP
jgi:hypothetical protein